MSKVAGKVATTQSLLATRLMTLSPICSSWSSQRYPASTTLPAKMTRSKWMLL